MLGLAGILVFLLQDCDVQIRLRATWIQLHGFLRLSQGLREVTLNRVRVCKQQLGLRVLRITFQNDLSALASFQIFASRENQVAQVQLRLPVGRLERGRAHQFLVTVCPVRLSQIGLRQLIVR